MAAPYTRSRFISYPLCARLAAITAVGLRNLVNRGRSSSP
jgi:hypothetical protein